jgi:hypothetical protein
MIPFNVSRNSKGDVVGITFESLVWFFIVTAGATVLGEYIYQAYVLPKISTLTTDTSNLISKL